MTMHIKEGVRIDKIHNCVKMRFTDIEHAFIAGMQKAAVDGTVIITSGCEGYRGDGVHSFGSLHYPDDTNFSFAIDLGVKTLVECIKTSLKTALGASWDVVFEGNHFHLERDVHRAPLTKEEADVTFL